MFKSRPRSVLGAPRRRSIPSLMAQTSTCSHRGQCPKRSPRAESLKAMDEAEIPKTHLRPLGHLPLGPAGWVLADLALVRPGDVGRLAEVAVDGAVEARGDHLPAAHDAKLVALAARAGALAPAARLPPAGRERGVVWRKPNPMCPHTNITLLKKRENDPTPPPCSPPSPEPVRATGGLVSLPNPPRFSVCSCSTLSIFFFYFFFCLTS